MAEPVHDGPIWLENVKSPEPHALTNDVFADVCIIGAGISGLSVAYHLTHAGKSVVLLDDGPVANGQTACTTAHLANALDDRFTEIERLHGEEGARLAAASHMAAIDFIESVVRTEKIDCDFQRLDGYLFAPKGDASDLIDHELEAARKAGCLVERLARAPLHYDTGPCLRFQRQGQFHPLKYTNGLARAIVRDGGRIFSHTHATKVQGGGDAHVVTEKGPIVQSRAIVVATNAPMNDLVAIHTKQAPYMTYVIAGEVPPGSVPRALYWDTLDPYHYVRVQSAGPNSELLIVGGEDHKSGQATDTVERHGRLEAWARERFPSMGAVTHRWGGQVMETVDGLAYIGRNPTDHDNVYVVTGDSGMGMTHGSIAGMLISDLILGRQHPWAKLYDPARVTVSAAGEYLKENLNVALQYASLVTPGEVGSPDEVKPGTGAVMRHGLTKVALFRSNDGSLVARSAICPHLGCVVAWNQAEQSWDCPCHGSRFSCEGHLMNGPANTDLAPVEL